MEKEVKPDILGSNISHLILEGVHKTIKLQKADPEMHRKQVIEIFENMIKEIKNASSIEYNHEPFIIK